MAEQMTVEQELRVRALDMALRHVKMDHSAQEIVKTAEVFERFLRGETAH